MRDTHAVARTFMHLSKTSHGAAGFRQSALHSSAGRMWSLCGACRLAQLKLSQKLPPNSWHTYTVGLLRHEVWARIPLSPIRCPVA